MPAGRAARRWSASPAWPRPCSRTGPSAASTTTPSSSAISRPPRAQTRSMRWRPPTRRPASRASLPGCTRATRRCAAISNGVATRSTPPPARWACRSRTSVRPGRSSTSAYWSGPSTFASSAYHRVCLPRPITPLSPPGRTRRWRECRNCAGVRLRWRLRDLQRHHPGECSAARTGDGAHRCGPAPGTGARVSDGQPAVNGDGRAYVCRGGFPRSGPVPRVRAVGRQG